MAAKKGTMPPNAGKGRPIGAKNKACAEIKAMIEGALSDVGGQEYLARQAEENPVAFIGLLGKVLPKDVNLNAKLWYEKLTDEELDERLAELQAETKK